MKLSTVRRFSMAMSGAFVACLAFAAHGSTNVFDDAVFWFRGGKDISGDGYMQQGEFFDDLHADNDEHANHQMKMASEYYTGVSAAFKGNAVIEEEDVVFPALGTNFVKKMQVLHISDAVQSKNYFPFDVKPQGLFARENISNEYTVVSRIRLDDDTYNRIMCLMKLGYNSSEKKGMWLGFAAQNANKCRRIAVQRTPNSAGVDSTYNLNLYVPTNTWVDLAVVVGGGRLRVGIAVPASLASHGDNSTIAFDQTAMWTDNCTILGDENYRFFCKEGQTEYKGAGGTDMTAFIGSVQQMAIWKRQLSDQEVMAAFGMPRPAIFRTGFDNGNSNEFGGERSGDTQTIDGLGSWQNIANTMQAGDTWTVNFDVLRDEAGLPQIFSIKSLRGSPAQIEPTLNGTSLGENRVGSNGRTFWPVPAGLINEGANTLVIERNDGGNGIFKLDAMELGGSLGVGTISESSTDDGRTDPESTKTGVPSAADPNPQHWPQELQPYSDSGITNLHLRVWIDPDVAEKASFVFRTAAQAASRSSTQTASASDYFSVYINGIYRTKLRATSKWVPFEETTFNPCRLHGGWNDFEFITPEAYQGVHWFFDYFRFEATLPSAFGFPPPPGMSLILK